MHCLNVNFNQTLNVPLDTTAVTVLFSLMRSPMVSNASQL